VRDCGNGLFSPLGKTAIISFPTPMTWAYFGLFQFEHCMTRISGCLGNRGWVQQQNKSNEYTRADDECINTKLRYEK